MARMIKVLAVMLVLGLFATAQAAPWVEVHSPNFEVYCDCGAAAARNLAGQMERMRQLFHQLFPSLALNPAQPLEIVAVRNWEEFQALEPAEFMRATRKSSSIYQPTEFLDFILLRMNALDRPGGFATIYHEYAHYLVDRLPFAMPAWLNEGIAEFLQTARIAGTNAEIGRTDNFSARVLHAPRLMPLKQLFAVGPDSPYHFDQDKGSIFYPESWAVVHYLLLGDLSQHAHRLNDYLTRVKDGAEPVSAAVASFGDPAALQKAVIVSLRPWNLHESQVTLPADVQEQALHATPLTDAEDEVLQASVLAHGRRYAAADAMAQSILRRDPTNARAEQIRGLIAFRRHEYTGAQRWLGRAVKANPEDVLAAVLLAEAMLRGRAPSPGTAAALLPSLQNATMQRPDFAPAFDLLAQVEAALPHELPAAMAAEAHAISLQPGEWSYRWNAATLQFNAGNLQEAIGLFREAERRTDSLARVGQCREAILQAQGQLELQAQTAQHNAVGTVPVQAPAASKRVAWTPPSPPSSPLVIRGRVGSEACPTGAIDSLWLDLNSHGLRLHFSAGKQFSWRGMVMPGEAFDPCRDMTGREVIVHARDGEMTLLEVVGVRGR